MTLKHKKAQAEKEILTHSKDSFFIMGFSGGKDSSVALDLLLKTIVKHNLKNPVYILAVRTESEYPEYEEFLDSTIREIKSLTERKNLSNVKIIEKKVRPDKRFLFLLCGRGYPVPRTGMRWCTLNMKIDTVDKEEEKLKKKHPGLKPVKILGMRREESLSRAKNIETYHNQTKNGIHSLMIIRDFSLADIWNYIETEISFSKKQLYRIYEKIGSDTSGQTRQGCWFCPLIKEDRLLKKHYPSIEKFRVYLKSFTLKPGTRYQINRRFTKRVTGPLKISVREEIFRELIISVKTLPDKKRSYFLPLEEVLMIQKEHIKEGNLNLFFLKEYLKLDQNKEIKNLVTSVDSFKVLFPRFKSITEFEYFQDIKPVDFAQGLAKRILLNEKIEYGYLLKDIKKGVDDLNIEDSLKTDYFKLQKKLGSKKYKKNMNETFVPMLNLASKILHNYYYYLHKFKNL